VKNLFTLHFFQVADYFKEQQGKNEYMKSIHARLN